MTKREKRRAHYKTLKRGYYHLCTDGWTGGRICYDDADYVFVVNTLSLLNLLFPVTVHFYEVMRNHIHLLISGRGAACVAVFDYLKKRINLNLKEKGHQALPPDYDFKLIPIENEEQMRRNIAYMARNASEVQPIVPGGYLWGASMMFFSSLPRLFETVRAGDLSDRALIRMFRTRQPIPPDRPIHPGLGMALPQGFVDPAVFYKVFPTAKEYETKLVKDYEAFVDLADQTGETIRFTQVEADDILRLELERAGLSLDVLNAESRVRYAILLHRKYRLDVPMVARMLRLSTHVIEQALRSKRFP
ncbi:MAG: hypothetical protein IJ611_03780 [Bacteroidales bacterium]|nr:hypothetical protein [Bacteroidales bacterium]